MSNTKFTFPYKPDPKYGKSTAYFSMEFGIHQAFKIYSGGLGYLAGSHMRSAYELKQNFIGIGILWKYGYYDQVRKGDKTMFALFQEKLYSFLEDIGVEFSIPVHGHQVKVKALYLKPEVFGTVPMFFLTTDLPENDYLSQTISHKLYDGNELSRVAQYVLLGIGGAKLIDELELDIETYHFNEAHALSACFYLYDKYKSIEELRSRVVFTTHTPEKAGNEENDFSLLDLMGFFYGVPEETVREITGFQGNKFNHTVAALRIAKASNAVSKKHAEVANEMWSSYDAIPEIISITNAQNFNYWADKELYRMIDLNDDDRLIERKKELKSEFFEVVADQTGKLFDPEVLTIVWARRFAEYKRADLITLHLDRFKEILSNKNRPVQIIWAGKPYPQDFGAMSIFDNLVHMNRQFMNSAILVGYELNLSKLCKQGSDIWLNTPRPPREASGTSGMTAAMNGSINFSLPDGWVLEFSKHMHNSFVIPEIDRTIPHYEQDHLDATNLLDVLEKEILPTYYDHPEKWGQIMKNSMSEVIPYFDSARMADEYYAKLYKSKVKELNQSLLS
ncbi:MAG: alpha-glucan family phosphorylase [Bacteroidetes bacterium]|nr:alpha-glucan family phosphorylase [Bacteroidota bacterium]MDA1121126.1 alpha-glucan family phosphorylase [Bacteroidota bacterium]